MSFQPGRSYTIRDSWQVKICAPKPDLTRLIFC
jgi:hypothetical protein